MNVVGWAVVVYLDIALLIAFRVGWVFTEELSTDDVALATFAIIMAALWPLAIALYVASLLSRWQPERDLGMGE